MGNKDKVPHTILSTQRSVPERCFFSKIVACRMRSLKIIANKFALPYSLLIFNFVEYRLRSLKIIANKFALPYSLALYLQCIRATDYKTYENICSIALESPPRNRNEQKNIQLGLYHMVQTEPLYIRLVVSLRALARSALSFL